MKTGTRRFTALLCAFCMLFTSIPSSVMSDSLTEEIQTAAATPTELQPEETFTVPETADEAPQDEAKEKPQADRELEAGDDLTTTGELTETKKEYLIRFAPEKNQTMVLVLTADKELKATVQNETTGNREAFIKNYTDEDGTITWIAAEYKTEKGNTYLLRIAGESAAEFTLRLVRKSIFDQEQAAEDPAEEAGEEPAEEVGEAADWEPDEETDAQPAEATNEETEDTADENPGKASGEQVTEEPAKEPEAKSAEETSEENAEKPDGQAAEDSADETAYETEMDQPEASETIGDENADEPEEKEKPAADREITAGDDVTVSGEMNSSGEYLIRFTSDMDQTLYLILAAEDAEATVTDEQTDSTKPFTPDSTVDEAQTVKTVPFYKIKNGNSYLIRISGTGDFTIRLVRSSILKAEANRQDEPEETADPETDLEEDAEENPADQLEENLAEAVEGSQTEEPEENPTEEPEEDLVESEANPTEETEENLTEAEPEESEAPEEETAEEPVEESAAEPEEAPEEPETKQETELETDPRSTEEPEAEPEQAEEETPETPAAQAEPEATAEAETPATQTDLEPVEEETPASQTDLEPVEEESVEVRIDATDSDIEAYILFLSNAGIPEGTELQVRELTPEEQEAYQAQTAHALNAEDESYLRYTKYLEFTLVHDGWAIPLNAPAKVYVTLPDINEGADALQVVRFDNMTPVLLDSERTENTVSFETEGFDVFGIGNALVPVTDHETELVKVEVLSFSEDAPVNLTEAEAPVVIEGLEVLGTFTIEDNTEAAPETENQDGLFIKAELKQDAELTPMEGVALYSVDADGNTDVLMEQLTEDAKITELEATQVAVIKDTGFRHLTLTVNPDETTDDQIITLDGMMPKDAEAAVTDVTAEHAAANNMEIAEIGMTAETEADTDTSETKQPAEENHDADEAEALSEPMTEEAPATEDGKTAATVSEALAEAPSEAPRAKLIAAYDISILNGEEAYQPDEDKPIMVEILDSRITTDQNIELWHIKDDGTEEQITEFSVDEGRICFTAYGFSVYSIVKPVEFSGDVYGWQTISDLSKIEENKGYYLDHSGYFLTGGQVDNVTSDSSRSGMITTQDPYAGEGVPEAAGLFYFEKDTASNELYIYKIQDGLRQYIKMKKANSLASRAGLQFVSGKSEATAFSFTQEGADRYKIFATVGDKIYYWNYNNKDSYPKKGAIVGYDGATDSNVAKIRIQYDGGPYPDDPYELHGKTFSIAYYAEGVTGAGMLASETIKDARSRLLATTLLVRPSVIDNDGELLVAPDTDLSTWEFSCVRENIYQIRTDAGGTTKYIALHDDNLVLTEDENDTSTLIHVDAGTGENAGKYRFSVGDYSLALMGGNADNGFVSSNSASDKAWLNLVELYNILPEEEFQIYTAKKVSISDTNKVFNGQQVVIYARIWNEKETKYEHYAIDHDGTLFRVYESGDTIQWVGSQVNTALWDFTEYQGNDGAANYFYELYNAYSEKYIAPQRHNSQFFSDNTIGVNLTGRRDGRDSSTIIAWDDFYYEYAGLNVSGRDNVVSSSLNDACVFYFAIMDTTTSGALSTVPTVNNDTYGISMKMIDYNNAIESNRDSVQTAFFGRDSDKANLLTTDLKGNGYPDRDDNSSRSLQSLFEGASKVNHLFIQSTYNEGGYFVYDSTQNYAYLADGQNFTVYDQLATIRGRTGSASSWHGHLFPYNSLIDPETNEPWIYDPVLYNKNDVRGAELPDSDPRKGERLFSIPENQIDYFFGMEMEASFTQTVNGLDAWNHDIIFEFSGDDDFWLYVDGDLILDLGGVHSAMTGSVNFRTGQVKASSNRLYVYRNGKASYQSSGTLREIFEANYRKRNPSKTKAEVDAYLDDIFDLTSEGNYVFKDYTTHKMKVFYMERGAGGSNLRMRFNLASVKPGNVLLSKELEGVSHAVSMIGEYPYEIWYKTEKDAQGKQEIIQLVPNDVTGITVVYAETERQVDFRETFTVDGLTYHNVFLLKPDETAEIRMPSNAIEYYIKECAVDTEIYDSVTVNGDPITGTPIEGVVTTRMDFSIPYMETKARPRVPYVNHVDEDALGILEFTKKLFKEDGTTEIEGDSTTFNFRLYLGTEIDEFDNLPLANMYRYYIKDLNKEYCIWDVDTQQFVSYGKTESQMEDDDWEKVAFRTSMYGSISKIPVGYTVQIREVLFDTKYKIEERISEIPDGYSLQKYLLGTDETGNDAAGAPIPAQGSIVGGETTSVTVCNIKGWGLRLKKTWTDASFMTNRDPTYFAVFKGSSEDALVLVPDTVRQLQYTNDELYWYFSSLGGESFADYHVREITFSAAYRPTLDENGLMTGYDPAGVEMVANGGYLTLGGTQKGNQPNSYSYTVSYEQGSFEADSNIRVDTATNSRPGIKLCKTDMSNQPLPGATFELYQMVNGEKIPAGADSYTTGADGLITMAYLRYNEDYTLMETSAPAGYQAASYHATQIPLTIRLAGDGKTVTVTGGDGSEYYTLDNTVSESLVGTITIKNKEYTLQIRKVNDQNPASPIKDVHFALYRQVQGVSGPRKDYTPIDGYDDLVTDENGLVEKITDGFKNGTKLKPGTYYLVEKEPAAGYQPLSSDVIFTVSPTGAVEVNDPSNPAGIICEKEELAGGTTVEYEIVVPNITYSTATLKVMKTVDGTSADLNKLSQFSFEATVFMPGGRTVWKSYGDNGFNKGKKSFRLAHGDEYDLTVPVGSVIAVTEMRNDWYTTKVKWNNEQAQESFTYKDAVTDDGIITFINTRKTETVTVRKALSDPLTKTGQFAFTAVLTDYDNKDITSEVTNLNSFSINVTNSNGSKAFTLPKGAVLSVTEVMSSDQSDCYTQTCDRDGGQFRVGDYPDIKFTNTRKTVPVGVSKTLVDTTATNSVAFPFTLTLYNTDGETLVTNYQLYKAGNTIITTNKDTGIAAFTLSAENGQPAAVQTLTVPYGAVVKIEEGTVEGDKTYNTVIDYTAAGSTATSTGKTITRPITGEAVFAFTNTVVLDSVILSISKTVAGSFADYSKEFDFTVSGLTAGQSYSYVKYGHDGTEWTETENGIKTANEKGTITFKLSNRQKIELTMPTGQTVTIQEDNDGYTTDYTIDGTSSSGSTTDPIILSANTNIEFTNTKEAVAPTDYSSRHLPFVLLIIFGIGLLILGGVGVGRFRERQPASKPVKTGIQSHYQWAERRTPLVRGAPPSAPPCPRADLWVKSTGSDGKRGDPGL